MGQELQHKVDLNFIRYANCWEDAEVLVKALSPLGKGKKFLSVASAGDNSLMLLTLDPLQVIAADLNPVQLYLTELKMATMRCLGREEALAFLGFSDSSDRVKTFIRLRPFLSAAAARHWEQQLRQIEKGIVHEGKFEKYFRFFSTRVLPLIHSKKKVSRLLEHKPSGKQRAFYAQRWNNRRWRFFFRLFFSRPVLGRYGRDPEFLKQVQVRVSEYIHARAAAHLCSVNAQRNFMLHYQLNGNFGEMLPPYLWPENFELIRNRIDRVVLFHGDVCDAAEAHGKFDGMNLSNIFEYMSKPVFEETSLKLIRNTNPGALMCYWNLMVPRHVSAAFPNDLHYEEARSKACSSNDKGFFYSRFIIDQTGNKVL